MKRLIEGLEDMGLRDLIKKYYLESLAERHINVRGKIKYVIFNSLENKVIRNIN